MCATPCCICVVDIGVNMVKSISYVTISYLCDALPCIKSQYFYHICFQCTLVILSGLSFHLVRLQKILWILLVLSYDC